MRRWQAWWIRTGTNNVASQTKAKSAGQKPVTAHPLFPAIVALWFAALIGIGSLVLPQTLYDQAGAMMGLGTLGLSARIGVALIAGFAGGALGLFVARKASVSHSARQPAQAGPAPQPKSSIRPISAMEELGSDRLDEPLANRQPDTITGRRRSLSLNDESGPSEYLAQVPLPGGNATLDLIGAEQFEDDSALELSILAEPEADEPAVFERAEIAVADRQVFQPAYDLPETQAASTDNGPVHTYDNADADWTMPSPQADAVAESAAEPSAHAPRPFSPPSSAPFAAAKPALFGANAAPVFGSHGLSGEPAVPAAPFAMPAPAPAADEPGALAAAARPVMAPFTMPAPDEHAVKVDALSGTALPAMALADLIGRFAEALRRADPASLTSAMPEALRQYAPESELAQQPAVAASATGSDLAAGADDAGRASFACAADDESAEQGDVPGAEQALAPDIFGMSSLPAALIPIGYDDGEDGHNSEEDEADSHRFEFPFASLPAASEPEPAEVSANAAPAAPFGLPQVADPVSDAVSDAVPDAASDPVSCSQSEAEEDHPQTDDTFGSLLAMKSGFGPGREFVRIEDEPEPVTGIEPVVVFPGTASPGRAAPAADGPSREAIATASDTAPPFAPGAVSRVPFGVPQQAAPADPAPVDRTATEQALRDALAKLQQMSGAA